MMNEINQEKAAVPDVAGIIFRRDLAKILNLSSTTLMRWKKGGRLPASRAIGPRLRGWSRNELIDAGFLKG